MSRSKLTISTTKDEKPRPPLSRKRLPTPLITVDPVAVDETPTPTRLLRVADEVGLFQDLNKANPFDEDFRKAAEAVRGGQASTSMADDQGELHTPQIVLEASTPLVTPAPPSEPAKIKSAFRPIAPAATPPVGSAALMLQLPDGGTLKLSDFPVIKQMAKPRNDFMIKPISKKKRRTAEKSTSAIGVKKEPSAPVSTQRQELLERNRAAAIRSRQRKKEYVDRLEAENLKLKRQNKAMEEHIRRLEESMKLHANCDVTRKVQDPVETQTKNSTNFLTVPQKPRLPNDGPSSKKFRLFGHSGSWKKSVDILEQATQEIVVVPDVGLKSDSTSDKREADRTKEHQQRTEETAQ